MSREVGAILQPDAEISLVVVTYNSASVLPPLLNGLSAAGSPRFRELVFVDNASRDQTPERIRAQLPQAQVIVNEKNRGFAAAVNQGVSRASAEVILLANPDVQWDEGVVPGLIQFLKSHVTAAAVCPRLIYPDGRPQPSIRRFPTHSNIWFSRGSPLRILGSLLSSRHGYTLPDPQICARLEAVAATFMVFRREAFWDIGGMDERFFLYVEDTDLCKRWHDAGYEVWMNPDFVVTHDWQGGSGAHALLRKRHRAAMRQYFETHHSGKPVRNALLFTSLRFADWWDKLRFGDEGRAGE